MHSLEKCQVRGDLMEVFKWFKGIIEDEIHGVLKISNRDRTYKWIQTLSVWFEKGFWSALVWK